MTAIVYSAQSRAHEAQEFAAQLRESEEIGVLQCNARYYHGEVHNEAEVVYHDGSEPRIPEVCGEHGIRCERWDDGVVGGYEVRQNGTWYKLFGPDGEQVGKSQRSEEDAWALLDEA